MLIPQTVSLEGAEGVEMQTGSERVIKSIRLKDEVHYRARVAAITARQTLGEWIEEAINEKLNRTSGELKGPAQQSPIGDQLWETPPH